MISPDQFRRAFDAYAYSVFRLETLQEYREPDEAALIAAFRAGKARPADPGKDEWLAAVRRAKATGRSVARAHVVREPLSDYLRFELTWSYAPNVAAGEEIRIIPLAADDKWPKGIPQHDFWLFDSAQLYVQHYDSYGMWLGVEHVIDPDRVAEARRCQALALQTGVPWRSYIAAHPSLLNSLHRAG